jgi:hypothetical protein
MRKRYRQFYFSIVLFIINNTYVNAQDYLSFYNLGDYVTQTQNIAPVFLPKNSFTLALPFTNIGFNQNSGFKINDLLIKNKVTNKLELNFSNLYNDANEVNDFNIDMTFNLFYIAFKRKKGSITIFANTRATNNWRFTKDFLGITANGIIEGFYLKDQNEYTGYNEIGIGFTQTFLEEKLAIGLRVKYINGFTHSSNKNGSLLSLDIDEATGDYKVIVKNATVNNAGSLFNDDTDEFKMFTENIGYGLDFGVTFKATDRLNFEIAFNDIGSITWKEDIKNLNIEDTSPEGIIFDGIDPSDIRLDKNLLNVFYDELQKIISVSETSKSFKTNLNMKTYLSARYAITERNLFTISAFNTQAFDDFKTSYSLGYNRTLKKKTYGFLAGLGGIDNEFLLGANFAVNLGPVQIYAATDSVKAIFYKPEESTGANLRLGLNFVFGYD